MKKISCILFVIGVFCVFSAAVMGQSPFDMFDKIKQKVQPTEEKGGTQEKTTQQPIGTNQKQEAMPASAPVKSETSAVTTVSATETEERKSTTTIKESELKIIATDIGNNPLKIFDIPLNATIQETVDILEKKEVKLENDFNHYFIPVDNEKTMKQFKDQLNRTIANYYQKMNPSKKDEALKILNEKVKYFQFKYKDKEYLLYPQSLVTLPELEGLYPLFHKYYDIYNSMFVLTAKGDNLSPDMKSQKIGSILIAFVSIGQDMPRSFLISLKFEAYDYTVSKPQGTGKLFSALTEKYGEPILYYSHYGNSGSEVDVLMPLLIDKFKNNKEVGDDCTLYKGLVQAISDSSPQGVYDDNFIKSFEISSLNWQGGHYRLEWNYKGNKVIYNNIFNEDAQSDIPFFINYIYCPLAKQVEEMFSNLFSESKAENSKLKGEASSKF